MPDQLLRDAQRAGLYTLPAERRLALEKASPQFLHRHVRLEHCATTQSCLTEFGRQLAFPDWYGANFDALNDCLSDPEWQPAEGHLIYIEGLTTLRQGDPDGFATLIEVLQAVAEERQTGGQPFWLLIDTPARGVAAFPSA